MDRSPTRDFIVGLFVLAGLGAVAYLSFSIGGFTWHGQGGLKLSSDFAETGDLAVRAPVVIGGVRVGEVTGIRLVTDKNGYYRSQVEMNLRPDLRLDNETTASIVTAGMLGDRYVELQPGGGERWLKSGDMITHVENAVILERVLGQIVYGLTSGSSGSGKPGAATGAGTTP